MAERGNFIYKDLNYVINGCAFEAFKEVGVGFNETIYHKFFHQKLIEKGLKAKYKVPLQAKYRNEIIADFELDEVVEECLVVELKCIQSDFISENYAQIINYLKLMQLKLGLLINFGSHKAISKRVIFDENRIENTESWDNCFFLNFSLQKALDGTISSIRAVDTVLGPGYHSKLYKAALKLELSHNQIEIDESVSIMVESEIVKVEPMKIDFRLVEKTILLAILATNKTLRKYDIFRMRSYLTRLKIRHGLIAFWSKNNLQIYVIYSS